MLSLFYNKRIFTYHSRQSTAQFTVQNVFELSDVHEKTLIFIPRCRHINRSSKVNKEQYMFYVYDKENKMFQLSVLPNI